MHQLIVHGHFYQPPREDPWTGRVPLQEGASPYHDWNARIAAECYVPNTESPVLDADGRTEAILNNYDWLHFDFGPTLLRWMETEEPQAYAAIIDADRRSWARFHGHGNAIAQAYNHVILPLADERDLQTQILWGLADFEHRFGRRSESIWLPETAVDARTVDALVRNGIRYVILAPSQAKRVRPIGGESWKDVSGGKIETRTAYRITAKEGTLSAFFYDGPLAAAVSFEHLLRNASQFADRLVSAAKGGPRDGLVHLATDGEVYGHHEMFGDMCLASLIHREAPARRFQWTNYGAYLDHAPPRHEVDLDFGPAGDGSSWSCAHGIERWRSDCGCSTGGQAGWNQKWRAPLRAALSDLRDRLRETFLEKTGPLMIDPWEARDRAIEVVLDRSRLRPFLDGQARRPLDEKARRDLARLFESQHQAMLMFTSCAWFFADLAGIEVRQNLGYAARAIELAQPYAAADLEERFVEKLAQAKSNVKDEGNGADFWRRAIRPTRRTRVCLAVETAGLSHAGVPDVDRWFPAFRCSIETQGSGRDVVIEDRATGETTRAHVTIEPDSLALLRFTVLEGEQSHASSLEQLPVETRRRIARFLLEERLDPAARAALDALTRLGPRSESLAAAALVGFVEEEILRLLDPAGAAGDPAARRALDLLRVAELGGLTIPRARIASRVYALSGRHPDVGANDPGIDPETLTQLAESSHLRTQAPAGASATRRHA
jgi:hypothetical protein